MVVPVLRDKDEKVLQLIVETYLKLGRPVSSGAIARKADFAVSPATVRNIMAELERGDYLHQPHTSAGRVPTDKGLRIYVNTLLREAFVSGRLVDLTNEDIDIERGDYKSIFKSTSRLLSEYSDNIGFVISPRISRLGFRYLRFIKVGENKVLFLLVTPAGLVVNEIVESRNYFTQAELDRASRYINENFPGRHLLFVRDYLVREVPKYKTRVENTLERITDLLKTCLNRDDAASDLFIQGTAKLLEKPELFDMQRLNVLFRSFEEKAKLAKLLSDVISLDQVKVLIGSELEDPRIAECSLVLAHYGDSRQVLGSLGIIGPKRIPYKKIIPLVECVAKRLSRKISSMQ